MGRRVGGAVSRNRVRRQVREAYRRRHPEIIDRLSGRTDTLTLGLVFRGKAGIRWPELSGDTNALIDKLLAELR